MEEVQVPLSELAGLSAGVVATLEEAGLTTLDDLLGLDPEKIAELAGHGTTNRPPRSRSILT